MRSTISADVCRTERYPSAIFDEHYIAGLRNRDPEVEAHFVTHFRQPILAKAHRQLWVSNMAEDVYQITMMRTIEYFRSGKPLDDPACLPGFVLGVCHNVIQEINRKGPNRLSTERWDLPDPAPGPDEEAERAERERLALEVIRTLRKRDQELLRFTEEMQKLGE